MKQIFFKTSPYRWFRYFIRHDGILCGHGILSRGRYLEMEPVFASQAHRDIDGATASVIRQRRVILNNCKVLRELRKIQPGYKLP